MHKYVIKFTAYAMQKTEVHNEEKTGWKTTYLYLCSLIR
jgi:hypothetical protein